jgi:hypothetical protein
MVLPGRGQAARVNDPTKPRHAENRRLRDVRVPKATVWLNDLHDGGPYDTKEITRISRQSWNPLHDHFSHRCLYRKGIFRRCELQPGASSVTLAKRVRVQGPFPGV